MGRLLSYLVIAMAVGCIALVFLLPLSKLPQRDHGVETDPAATTPAVDDKPAPVTTAPPATPPLSAGTDTSAADIPAADESGEPGLPISGKIVDTYGSAVPGAAITLESKGFDGEEIVESSIESNRYGEFTLRLVPERQYRLSIGAQDNYAGFTLDGFSHDSAGALENIVLEPVELVDIEGLIVDTDLAPVADFEMTLRHLSLEFPERMVRSDSSGYFKISGYPAGEVRIATSQSDYYRIEGLKLEPGEYRNLMLMIDRGAYHLSGWVRDNDGTPRENVIVTLKSAFATDQYHSISYRSVNTDASGGFKFGDLGGHPLTLGVYAPGFEVHIQQHRFESFSDRIEIVLKRE